MAYMDINTEEANRLKTEYEQVEQELKEEIMRSDESLSGILGEMGGLGVNATANRASNNLAATSNTLNQKVNDSNNVEASINEVNAANEEVNAMNSTTGMYS